MANLTITPANVGFVDISETGYDFVEAGETITQGQPVYRSTSNNKFYRASAATTATAEAVGIAVTPAIASQPFIVILLGKVKIGATLLLGRTYVLSPTTGLIMPETDLAGGDIVTTLGVAITTGVLDVRINATGLEL